MGKRHTSIRIFLCTKLCSCKRISYKLDRHKVCGILCLYSTKKKKKNGTADYVEHDALTAGSSGSRAKGIVRIAFKTKIEVFAFSSPYIDETVILSARLFTNENVRSSRSRALAVRRRVNCVFQFNLV